MKTAISKAHFLAKNLTTARDDIPVVEMSSLRGQNTAIRICAGDLTDTSIDDTNPNIRWVDFPQNVYCLNDIEQKKVTVIICSAVLTDGIGCSKQCIPRVSDEIRCAVLFMQQRH